MSRCVRLPRPSPTSASGSHSKLALLAASHGQVGLLACGRPNLHAYRFNLVSHSGEDPRVLLLAGLTMIAPTPYPIASSAPLASSRYDLAAPDVLAPVGHGRLDRAGRTFTGSAPRSIGSPVAGAALWPRGTPHCLPALGRANSALQRTRLLPGLADRVANRQRAVPQQRLQPRR